MPSSIAEYPKLQEKRRSNQEKGSEVLFYHMLNMIQWCDAIARQAYMRSQYRNYPGGDRSWNKSNEKHWKGTWSSWLQIFEGLEGKRVLLCESQKTETIRRKIWLQCGKEHCNNWSHREKKKNGMSSLCGKFLVTGSTNHLSQEVQIILSSIRRFTGNSHTDL